MAVLPIKLRDVLWHVIVIFNVTFISLYIFMFVYCNKPKFEHIHYDEHLGLQVDIGESLDLSRLKTKRSLDSLLFIFKDVPDMHAVLNKNDEINKNLEVEMLFEHPKSQIKRKNNKTIYHSTLKTQI